MICGTNSVYTLAIQFPNKPILYLYCKIQTGKIFAPLKKFYKKILQVCLKKVNDITCRLPIQYITLDNINVTALDLTLHY